MLISKNAALSNEDKIIFFRVLNTILMLKNKTIARVKTHNYCQEAGNASKTEN